MKKIKAVVTDLDDTLLAPDKTISEVAIQVIREMQASGIQFSFITGRPKYAIERFVESVGVSAPVVSCNGAVVFQGDDILLKHSFPAYKLRTLMESAKDLGLTVLFYTDDVEYALHETAWVKVRVDAGRNFPIRTLTEAEWEEVTFEKLNIMADANEEGFAKVLPLIEALQSECSIALYGLNGCEIVSKEVNKGVGMKELAKLLGVEVEEIMAIGDNANDNEMLAQAGIGVAVGNAKETTKQCADYICEKSYTEGVIEAIEKFVMKRGA
ncbi:MAG: HAD family hydrolase [Cellulosilyticaceae bacterium]